MDAVDYGPWEIAGCQVRIEFEPAVRLAAWRDGARLKALPAGVRESEELAWIRLALQAAADHRRVLKMLLENAMTESIPLSTADLALLAADPLGRPMIAGLLLETEEATGLPLLEEAGLITLDGDVRPFAAPAVVVHPAHMVEVGTLAAWNVFLNRHWFRQPFKQIRRELYLLNDRDREAATFSDRFAGDHVRWDQARALLEGRGWYRVTKTGAERIFARAGLTAHLEFRAAAPRAYSREAVRLRRVYFLPRGEQAYNRANPGMPLEQVPATLFSEALRDVALVSQVAGR